MIQTVLTPLPAGQVGNQTWGLWAPAVHMSTTALLRAQGWSPHPKRHLAISGSNLDANTSPGGKVPSAEGTGPQCKSPQLALTHPSSACMPRNTAPPGQTPTPDHSQHSQPRTQREANSCILHVNTAVRARQHPGAVTLGAGRENADGAPFRSLASHECPGAK